MTMPLHNKEGFFKYYTATSAKLTLVSVPGRGGIFGWTRGVGCGAV